jgi:ribonuclease P protein component
VNSNPAGFGRADRLHRSGEFVTLQRRGARYQSEHFVLYGGLGGATGERSRLGITVSGRIGNAVVRNRLKRRVRECYRQKLRAMLPAGAEIVVIARRGAGELRWTAIDAELEAGIANLGRRLGDNSDIRQGDLRLKSTGGTERGRD